MRSSSGGAAANSKNGMREQILTDSLWRLLFKLSIPGVLGMSIGAVNGFVDGIYVGQFVGQDGLAAISVVFPLTILTSGLASMIGVGSSSVLSRAIGSQDIATQERVFGNLTALTFLVGVIFASLGYYFAPELVGFMGADGNVLDLGVRYYRILMIGMFFQLFGVAANMLIRAEGKLKEAMTFAASSMFLNMLITPVFILKFGWDIEGAAAGTITAIFIYSIINVIYFATGRSTFPVNFRKIKLDMTILPEVLSVGVSAMMMQLTFFVQQSVIFKSVAHYGGDRDIAFMGACYRVFMLAIVPIWGLSQAFQPVAGINYGAAAYLRVKEATKTFAKGGTILVTLVWMLLQIFPTTILGWLMPETTFDEADLFNFRMLFLTLPGMPLFFIGMTLFQAIGNGKTAAILLVARQVLIFIPIALVLPYFLGLSGIYISIFLSDVLVFLLVIWILWREFRVLTNKTGEVK